MGIFGCLVATWSRVQSLLPFWFTSAPQPIKTFNHLTFFSFDRWNSLSLLPLIFHYSIHSVFSSALNPLLSTVYVDPVIQQPSWKYLHFFYRQLHTLQGWTHLHPSICPLVLLTLSEYLHCLFFHVLQHHS